MSGDMAGIGDGVVNRFRGEYDFLSNFYEIPDWQRGQLWAYAPIVGGGIRVPTVEHAFQAAKASSVEVFMEIAGAETPRLAKRLGRKVKMSEAALAVWKRTKDAVMTRLVTMKFNPRSHPIMARLLDSTGDDELVEGNDWGDDYWGVILATGVGQNRLGKILMKVRKENRQR